MLNKLLLIALAFIAKGYAGQNQEEQSVEAQQNAVEDQQPEAIGKSKITKTVDFLSKLQSDYKLPEDKVDFAQSSIDLGKEALKAIYNNDKEKISSLTKDQNNYLKNIVDINWALFSEAVEKGQGFTGGTIVVEDPNLNLYNFLLNYAKLVNPDIKAGNVDLRHISNNCYAYGRHSTHFKELFGKPGFEQYGIDVRYIGPNNELGDSQSLLPANKQHILFGKLGDIAGKTYSFLKMELYGLCLYDLSAAKHGLQLLKSKKGGISRREDVPNAVKEKYKALLKSLPKAAAQKLKDKNSKTIRSIYTNVKNIAPDFKESKDLIKYLETNFDHLDSRRGNEVILSKSDILS